MANSKTYRGKEITKLVPSGYYEFYSDAQGRFLKFDELEDAKAQIDEELKSAKDSSSAKYEKGKVRKGNVLLEAIDFAVDTALSWEGTFPKVDKGDYIVMIEDNDRDVEATPVLVSRRYTSAVDHDQAAEIALDAWGERKGYGGPADPDTIRVVRVDAVMK
jgi:hypothetical protein